MSISTRGSALIVEEVYTYDVSLEETAQIKLRSREGRIQFDLPCSRKQLKYLLGQTGSQQLGTIVLKADSPEAQPEEYEITLDNLEDLPNLIEANSLLSWNYKYTPPTPKIDLFSAASIIKDKHINSAADIKERENKALFDHDLELSIEFNVPNLREADQQKYWKELHQNLEKPNSIGFGHLKNRPNTAQLAKEIAGMANAEGGQLFIKYNASLEEFKNLALKAILTITPLLPITITFFPKHPVEKAAEEKNEPSELPNYVRIEIPAPEKGVRYMIKNMYYKRDRDGNTMGKNKNRREKGFAWWEPRINLDEALSEVKAKRPPNYVFPIKDNGQDYKHRLAKAITSFVNKNVPHGMIVIRNLRPRWWQLRHELLEIINNQISPRLKIAPPFIRFLGREMIAIVVVDGTQAPAALYAGKGYRLEGEKFAEVPIKELYEAYERTVGRKTINYPQNEVKLNYLELAWPVDPFPEPATTNHNVFYDVQRHALIWKDVEPHKDKEGQSSTLWETIKIANTLQHAAVDKDRDGQISEDNYEISHEGHALLTISHVLASKSTVTQTPNTSDDGLDHGWFAKVPITRSTKLKLCLQVNLGDHWRSRPIQTLLHFPLRDTTAVSAFTTEWRQLCSDLGFTILGKTDQFVENGYYFHGVRQKQFHDIRIDVALFSHTQKVTREITYERRKDRKRVDMSTIQAFVWMAGGTSEATREICHLQNQLHQLATERFGYLSSDEA